MRKSTIIRKIQEATVELGRVPRKKEFSYAAQAVEAFGSWNEALTAAGYPHHPKVTAETLKQKLDERVEELGRIPKAQEFQPHYQVALKRYGSWKNALKALGYGGFTPEEQLKQEVFAFYEKHKRTPKRGELEHGNAIAKCFGGGSFNRAMQALGLDPATANGLSNDDLIKKIQNKAEELGRIPIATDVEQFSTIMRRFGSWNNALKAAGFETWKKTHNSHIMIFDQELLSDIQILILSKEGKRPLFREYAHGGLCLKRFGKWSHAVDKALEDPYHTMEVAKQIWAKRQRFSE